ncbi:MAG: hypothetical protein QME14_02465 [Methanobacteriaceae archaeon]|nr:hypothetical protein [Methanobacteriaceae archaeon]
MMQIINEEKAQVFSIDLMLGLIIITVILGISADSMNLASDKINENTYIASMGRLVDDAADVLVETPGVPPNWEESSNYSDITPGLAKYNTINKKVEPNILSIKKIKQLQDRYDELVYGKILPETFHSTLIIFPQNSKILPLIIHEDDAKNSSSDIYVINRTILTDFIDSKIVINLDIINSGNNDEIKCFYDKCPHKDLNGSFKHDPPEKGQHSFWICKHFKLSRKELDSNNFYIFSDPYTNSLEWIIDRNELISNKSSNMDSKPINVSDQLHYLIGDDESAVLWLHVKILDNKYPFIVYLVSIPKEVPVEMIDAENLKPIPCYFILKAWI